VLSVAGFRLIGSVGPESWDLHARLIVFGSRLRGEKNFKTPTILTFIVFQDVSVAIFRNDPEVCSRGRMPLTENRIHFEGATPHRESKRTLIGFISGIAFDPQSNRHR